MHQNALFWNEKKLKIFCGEGTPPSLHPTPLSALGTSILVPSGARPSLLFWQIEHCLLHYKALCLFCTVAFTSELIAKRHSWAFITSVTTRQRIWVPFPNVIICARFYLYRTNSFWRGGPPKIGCFYWLEGWPLQQLELYRAPLWCSTVKSAQIKKCTVKTLSKGDYDGLRVSGTARPTCAVRLRLWKVHNLPLTSCRCCMQQCSIHYMLLYIYSRTHWYNIHTQKYAIHRKIYTVTCKNIKVMTKLFLYKNELMLSRMFGCWRIFKADIGLLICVWFLGYLGLKWVFSGTKWGRGGAMLIPTNSFLLLRILTSVSILVKIDQEMPPWESPQSDTQIHWLTQTGFIIFPLSSSSSSSSPSSLSLLKVVRKQLTVQQKTTYVCELIDFFHDGFQLTVVYPSMKYFRSNSVLNTY